MFETRIYRSREVGLRKSFQPTIVALGGSLRLESTCYLALGHVVRLLHDLGCRAEIFDLRRVELPFCDGDRSNPWPQYPAVMELRHRIREADALVLATPEYHGGISGVLKNALDLLDFPHLEGKVVGGISVLGGRHNSNALNQLRTIVRWCRAWMIPEQIAIARAREVFTGGEIRGSELKERFSAFAGSLDHATRRLHRTFATTSRIPP